MRRKAFCVRPLAVIMTAAICVFCLGCVKDDSQPSASKKGEKRSFFYGFESADEFAGNYIVGQVYKNTTHELSSEVVYEGGSAHKARITGANPPSTLLINNNHRAYPTLQYYKTDGPLYCPIMITLHVWLDMELMELEGEDEWFSFATLTYDDSDDWYPVVGVNLSFDGHVHLMHVPGQGQKEWTYQNTDLVFPMRQWVELKIYYDSRPDGCVKVWQDGTLVSTADLEGGDGTLCQAHFGLYAAPSVAAGTVYNDALTITEID